MFNEDGTKKIHLGIHGIDKYIYIYICKLIQLIILDINKIYYNIVQI